MVSGGFDPIHKGHIQLLREAAEYGNVIVALNSDEWLTRKKGRPFMEFDERWTILNEIEIGWDEAFMLTGCSAFEPKEKQT